MPALDTQTVQTEFLQSIPADVVSFCRGHIAGPQAKTHRYTNAAEKPTVLLGDYNPGEDSTYDWPEKNAQGIVDLDFVQLHVDAALLKFYEDLIGVDDTITAVDSYQNRIVTSNDNGYLANGLAFPRLAALKDRDVQAGDIVHVFNGDDELWTYVASLVADKVAADVGTATSDSHNAVAGLNSNPGNAPTVNATGGGSMGGSLQAGTYFVRYSYVGAFGETWASSASTLFTVSAGNIPRVTIPQSLPAAATSANIYLSPTNGTALQCTLYKTGVTTTTTDLTAAWSSSTLYPASAVQTDGTVNDLLATASAASYNGSSTGDLAEIYTIQVTLGGAPGTARLSIISASGRDDQANVTPAAYSSPTTIGTRGLTVTWTHTSDNFVVGQTWRVAVRQAWTPPVPTSGGSYSGTLSQTYIIQVTRGGLYTDSTKPQITVTTNTGTDTSGPTTVTAAASNVAIGTLSVLLQFSGSGLRKGDVYTVPVTAPGAGAYRTLVLGKNLSDALLADDDLSVQLFIQKDIIVSAQRLSSPPDLNWLASANSLVVYGGMTAYDASLTDNGVAFAVPVEGGSLYAHYREWLPQYAGMLVEAAVPNDVNTLFATATPDDPDNPLCYGVYKAVQNSNGQVVTFTGIADPTDLDEWTDVLAMLVGLHDVYNLVPLSRDADVWTLYQTHVQARSNVDTIQGEWRRAWFNPAFVDTVLVVDSTKTTDHAVALATLTDNPDAVGTQYTRLTCTSGNADFVTNGVVAGDVVRYLYSVDAFGNAVYQSFLVQQVVNEDELLIAEGPVSPINTPQLVEVWRTLNKNDIANSLAALVAETANVDKRFLYVIPDVVTDDNGVVVPGYFLAAAYAGFQGGIAPQQGCRNVAILGFSGVPRTTQYFNNGQLNILGNAGCLVVTENTAGQVFAKFTNTPDQSSVETGEEAIVRRDDAARYLFYNTIAANFGQNNLTTLSTANIDNELKSAIQHGVSDTIINRIGPMFLAANLTRLSPHATIPNKIVAAFDVTRSYTLDSTQLILTF